MDLPEELTNMPTSEEFVENIEAADEIEPDDEQEARADDGPRLVIKRNGEETADVFPVRAPVVIGRFDPTVGPIDVDLGSIPEGSYVSRTHAKIEEVDGVFTITDLGSSNGTFLLRDDWERVESAEIEDGTEIALGNARMIFRTGE